MCVHLWMLGFCLISPFKPPPPTHKSHGRWWLTHRSFGFSFSPETPHEGPSSNLRVWTASTSSMFPSEPGEGSPRNQGFNRVYLAAWVHALMSGARHPQVRQLMADSTFPGKNQLKDFCTWWEQRTADCWMCWRMGTWGTRGLSLDIQSSHNDLQALSNLLIKILAHFNSFNYKINGKNTGACVDRYKTYKTINRQL